MSEKSNSVIVVGFNTRPLVYSLNKAGYTVYAVDFFGDLDLYPNVNDYIIVQKALKSDYKTLKDKYSEYLVQFAVKLYKKHQDIKFFLIGSGLDDAYEGRKLIMDEIKNSDTKSVNSDLEVIKKSRDIEFIYKILNSYGYSIPLCYSFEKFNLNECDLKFPFILKKKRSAGGVNVFKIENETTLISEIQNLEKNFFNPSEWLVQEYLKGNPISCTIISNGRDCDVISINRQLIGEKFLSAPKEFMYCGNIVPAGLMKEEEELISEISIFLTQKLGLIGINGFDFVLKDHYPYLMECNPRIPGSIRASEVALSLNLLDLHIKSFIPEEWKNIKLLIKTAKPILFVTKLIVFTPKEVEKKSLLKINRIKFVHDKSEPTRNILRGEPLCTILYKAKTFSKSFNGAKKVVEKIYKIIGYEF